MNIEKELNNKIKLLSFYPFSNKQKLVSESESLKELFNFTPKSLDSFVEAIEKLKNNLFYQQFDLAKDPKFISQIINKVEDIEIIEKIIDLSITPNYSQQEEDMIDNRHNILILLSILEDDLNEAINFEDEDENEDENEDDESALSSDFFEIYLEDFKSLKFMLNSQEVTLEDISWFLDSDLFQFISEAQECFAIEPKDFYKLLLSKCEITTDKDFLDHKHVLLEKKEVSNKDNETFNYQEFQSILDEKITKITKICNKNTFYSLNTTALSPIARQALVNNYMKNLK